ncbi:MAG: amidohydrolase family protein [Gemmatimonadota bacterium]
MSPSLPSGSWDCHAHVIEGTDRFPLAPGRSYEPPVARLPAYLGFLDRFGLGRGALVQPSVYGFDNRCMLTALEAAGGRLVGVAVPAPETGPGELEALHRRGVRGVRCNLLNPGGIDPSVVLRWKPVMRELGWHLDMHVDVESWGEMGTVLDRFGIPVVIDHMGRPDLARPWDRPGLRLLADRLREGDCFVKLSAPYRLSGDAPPWPSVTPLAQTLLEANPSRCLWASDWPHVDTKCPVHAEDLSEALADWCPDPSLLRILMKDTPEQLFCTGATP